MTEQFENQEAEQLDELTNSDVSAEKKIDLIAEKAAEKSTKKEQSYDKNRPIFSK
ncbi:MAG: hypothetical protein ABR928_10275 [Terracidiphilus sp.]|jgi:hypothetical protein